MLSSEMLSPESTAVVKATAGVVAENSVEITGSSLHMFAVHPELMRCSTRRTRRSVSNRKALAANVVAYAVNLIDPDAPDFGPRSCAGSPTSTCRWVSSPIEYRSSATTYGHRRRPRRRRHPEIAAAWDEVYWLSGCQLLAGRPPLRARGAPTPSSRGASTRSIERIDESENLLPRPRPVEGKTPITRPGQYVAIAVDPAGRWRQPRYTISSRTAGNARFG